METTALQLLAELVRIPSVAGRPNGALVDYVRGRLSAAGVASTVVAGPDPGRYNLFATVGPPDVPGYVLSSHLDVVPAREAGWDTDPFVLTEAGDRLIGRGTVVMKGFVAAVLASLPAFLERPLARPLHLAFSYDEECGCLGMRRLIERLPSLCATPAGCIVGEPTGLRPVLRHKGRAAMRLSLQGRAMHSARPDLGVNAIHAAADAIACVRDTAAELAQDGPFDAAFEPPCSTMQVSVVAGGSAVNVVPESCLLEVEARAVPGVDPKALLQRLADRVAAGLPAAELPRLEWEWTSHYPPLDLSEDEPLVAFVEELTGRRQAGAVSFGSDAGLFQQAGIPALVCGPGDVDRAHRPNEYILRNELADCMIALRRLAGRLAA